MGAIVGTILFTPLASHAVVWWQVRELEQLRACRSQLARLLACRVGQSSSPVDSDEDRAQWAKSTAQAAIRPAIGLPLYAALFAAALIAKNALAAEWAGLVLFLLLFVFPYYQMQLAMRWRLRQHERRHGLHLRYVPGSLSIGAALYLGFWFLTAWLLTSIDRFTKP